jgi:hypothetical protein
MKTIFNIKNRTKTTAEDDIPIVGENDIASVPAIENIEKRETLKASAKTKLMAGEPLTEEEANVMIGG